MIIDRFNLFADDIAPTFTVSTTNLLGVSVDLGIYKSNVDNVGVGHPYYLALFISEGFTSAGAATMQFELQTDDNSGMSSPTFMLGTKTYTLAELANPGRLFVTTLPSSVLDYEQYIGVFNTNNNVLMTAGKISAFITRDIQDWHAYPQGNVAP